MKTKPRGIWATFAVDCPKCGQEFTVTNGRHDPHDCGIERLKAAFDAAFESRT